MPASIVPSGHQGSILDMSADPAGRYAATGGDDGVVLVHEIRGTSSGIASAPQPRVGEKSSNDGGRTKPSMSVVATLKAHDYPVIRVSWAPPRVAGHPLATSGLDGTVNVWKSLGAGIGGQQAGSGSSPAPTAQAGGALDWQVVYTLHFPAPVVAMAWSPEEFGVALACACADGRIYVIDNTNRESWGVTHFDAHPSSGCTGVSWCPYMAPGALLTMALIPQQVERAQPPPSPTPRLVTCGNESSARIWRYSRAEQMWLHEGDLLDSPAMTQREIAWAPNVGLPFSYIAAASDDRYVTIWQQDAPDGPWRAFALPPFAEAVVRLSWTLVGTFLLVSCANNSASIWKEDAQGGWLQVSIVETTAPPPAVPPPQQRLVSSGPSVAQNSARPQVHQQTSYFQAPPSHSQSQARGPSQLGGLTNEPTTSQQPNASTRNTLSSFGGGMPVPQHPLLQQQERYTGGRHHF